MLMDSIQPASPVPADDLFPSWRGREDYRARLNSVHDALHRDNPGLADAVAAVPFERFEATHGPRQPVFKYNRVPDAAAALAAEVPEDLRSAWLCALLLWHIGRFDQAFADSGLPGEFALHYADGFHRMLDQVEKDASFADLARDSFLKDLWLARGVMIPAFAQLWWPHSGISAAVVLRAGPAATARVFLGCGGRRPFLEGHTHDPMAKAYWNEKGWGEALRLAALALPALPAARGVFGSAWFYDPAIMQLSPRISFTQDLQLGRGAWRIRVGSNPDAIANATATSAERRNRFRNGSYLPTDYAMIWSRARLLAAYGV